MFHQTMLKSHWQTKGLVWLTKVPNGTFVNNAATPVGRGNTIILSDGDLISMGEFSLQITVITDHQASAPSDHPFGDAPKPGPAAAGNAADPFFGLEDIAAPGKSPLKNDEHLDRLEDIGIGPSAWDTDSSAVPGDPFGDFSHTSADEKTDPFGDSSFNSPSQPAKNQAADNDDWSGWIGSLPTTPAAGTPNHIPVNTTHQVPSNTPGAPASGDALHALLAAAGLTPGDFSHVDQIALAAHIGGVLKKSTLSMMLLLRSRDEIKSAMRADVTLLAAQNNSPLQFSLSVEDALKKLLTPSADAGYAAANKAIDKGLQDIKIHQLAMLEAMRSALQIALSHFDPQALEQQSRDASPLASSLPLAREAKLWEQFQSRYNDIKTRNSRRFQ